MARSYENLETQAAVEAIMSPDGETAVIDFWAPWCGPCKSMAPHFDKVAQDNADTEVGFYKINTEAHPAFGRAFNVRSIPTLVFVDKGEILDVHIGFMNHERLQKKVDWLLSKARGEGFFTRLFGGSRKQADGG